MQAGAHVTSLEALSEFRAAICLFRDEADQAVAILQSEIGRFVDWLEHDQLAYWRHEIRLREERLAEAKTDLHRCLAATIDPQRTPSCYQEKKVVEAAKRQLAEAEEKLSAVRRWIPLVRQAVLEYRLKVEPLTSALAADVPRAIASLDATVARVLAYLDAAPASGPATAPAAAPAADSGRASVALPLAEAPPAPAAADEAPVGDATAGSDRDTTGAAAPPPSAAEQRQ